MPCARIAAISQCDAGSQSIPTIDGIPSYFTSSIGFSFAPRCASAKSYGPDDSDSRARSQWLKRRPCPSSVGSSRRRPPDRPGLRGRPGPEPAVIRREPASQRTGAPEVQLDVTYGAQAQRRVEDNRTETAPVTASERTGISSHWPAEILAAPRGGASGAAMTPPTRC
jgi:hypothetical protein